MAQKGKLSAYSAFLEGARAPLELDISAFSLEGQTVSIKYLTGNGEQISLWMLFGVFHTHHKVSTFYT